VLACGPDVPYPRAHAALLADIAARGAVVSECPPGCPPSRRRFLGRNRIIAALARGTIVIEAAERSGTLVTARHASDLARPLMAVPGPATSATSAG
jgi:DNA processing protein